MEKVESKKVLLYSVIVMTIILVVVGVSYAYFSATANSNEQVVQSGVLEITYQNGQNIATTEIVPTTEDEADIHQFTVTNTGTLDTTYSISMINISLQKSNNPTTSFNLNWALYETNSDYVEGSLLQKGTFSPESNYQLGDSNHVIISDLSLPASQSQSYSLKVWLQETGTPQNEDQGMSLSFTVEVNT